MFTVNIATSKLKKAVLAQIAENLLAELILPPSYGAKRSTKVTPDRYRGYGRHKCGAEAFWFTKFGKAWFNYDMNEIFFEDGQIKLKNRPIEEYRCPHCSQHLQGKDIKLVKIIQEDEADALHAQEHRKVPVGVVCELCGERKKG